LVMPLLAVKASVAAPVIAVVDQRVPAREIEGQARRELLQACVFNLRKSREP
jgi:hypothetical protein